jgi:prepilin-type N-terminal cleavage/methylation domain-containing protein
LPRRDAGYTLVELVVVILIFAIVMSLISLSFNRIMSSSGQVMKSTETDIGGLIGLELLRIDLELAGFGLPWSLGSAKYDGEAVTEHLIDNNPETNATKFNDSSDNGPPRAFVMNNDLGFRQSDYLVLKGSALGSSTSSRGWSYLNYTPAGVVLKPSKSEVELVPGNKDRVIIVNSGVRDGVAMRELVTEGSDFAVTLNDPPPPVPAAYQPGSAQDSYLVYGISPARKAGDPEDKITFPFNRADYYIGPSDSLSSTCAPGTGALFRGHVSQKGYLKAYPILDCVADFQVIFLLNTSNDGSLVPTNDIGSYSAAQLRALIKEVRVYILAQQGAKDAGYRFPVTDPNQVIVLGDQATGRSWKQAELEANFGSDWLHYHWKVLTIVVQPKNLN